MFGSILLLQDWDGQCAALNYSERVAVQVDMLSASQRSSGEYDFGEAKFGL